jgi:hypothetical protein
MMSLGELAVDFGEHCERLVALARIRERPRAAAESAQSARLSSR